MFGAKISNAQGSTIIGDGERSFLYWGKKSVTLPAATNYETASTFVNLFNIPSFVPVTIFSASGGGGALVILDASTSINRARCLSNDGETIEIYVFVSANYVPKPSFGMVIIEQPSYIKWHSGRPAISYKDVRIETNNANALNQISVTYKPAVQVGGIYGSTMTISTPSGSYDGYVWQFFATTSGGFKHGMKANRVISSTGGYFNGEYYAYNTNDIPVTYFTIDASYYDQFSNLPNYN